MAGYNRQKSIKKTGKFRDKHFTGNTRLKITYFKNYLGELISNSTLTFMSSKNYSWKFFYILLMQAQQAQYICIKFNFQALTRSFFR